jgi:hypothetical protein
MKYLPIILIAMLCRCSPDWAPVSTLNEAEKTALIRVEYKDPQQIENSVIQILKMARYNDLEKDSNSSPLIIKARYQELSYQKAMQVTSELKNISGVLDVQIIRDGVPVKNVR